MVRVKTSPRSQLLFYTDSPGNWHTNTIYHSYVAVYGKTTGPGG